VLLTTQPNREPWNTIPFDYCQKKRVFIMKYAHGSKKVINYRYSYVAGNIINKRNKKRLTEMSEKIYKEKLYRNIFFILWVALIFEWIIAFIYLHEITQGFVYSWLIGLELYLLLYGLFIALLMVLIRFLLLY